MPGSSHGRGNATARVHRWAGWRSGTSAGGTCAAAIDASDRRFAGRLRCFIGGFNAFRDAMRQLGYIEGRNIRFECRFADGIIERTRIGHFKCAHDTSSSVQNTSFVPAGFPGYNESSSKLVCRTFALAVVHRFTLPADSRLPRSAGRLGRRAPRRAACNSPRGPSILRASSPETGTCCGPYGRPRGARRSR
jgi:hypothetical protein